MTYVRQILRLCYKCTLKYNSFPRQCLEPIFFYRREMVCTAASALSSSNSVDSVVSTDIKGRNKTNTLLKDISEIKDNSSQHQKERSGSKMLEIKEFTTLKELENFINNNNFSGEEAVPIYFSIKKVKKLMCVSEDSENWNDFIKSAAFLKLCKIIEKNLPKYNARDLKNIAEFLKQFNIPESSNLFQKTLQLVLDNFNKFSSFEVLELFKLTLIYKKNNYLISFVRLACLEFMSYCFDSKRSPNESIESIIFYSNQKIVPYFIREKLIQDALNYNHSILSPKWVTELCWAITQPDVKTVKNDFLIKKFLTTLQSMVDETWPDVKVVLLIRSYCIGCVAKKFMYSEEFADRIGNIALKNEYSLQKAIMIAKSLCLLPHLHTSLLKYIVHKAFIEEDEISELNALKTYFLIAILGISNFKSFNNSNWEYYRKKLLVTPQLSCLSQQSSNVVLYSALNLATLGVYDSNLLRKAMSLGKDCLVDEPEKKEEFRFRNWCLLLLHQCVSVLHPSFDGQKISDHILKSIAEDLQINVTSYGWANVVQKCFGGENYVLTNCTTSLYHALSYVLILDENNKPVDVSAFKNTVSSNSEINIEKISLQTNQKMLIILEFPKWMRMYFKNVDVLLGFGKLYIQVLEGMGYNVIHLSPDKLVELMDVEQVPYLINEIEKKYSPISGQISTKTEL